MDFQTQKETPNRSEFLQIRKSFRFGFFLASSIFALIAIGVGVGVLLRPSQSSLPKELLQAAASHGSSTMAIATGPIDEDSEGIFFLDYITGDLQCWVYYPRLQTFGAKFGTNVRAQLPSGKNPEYLLVTGAAVTSGASSNTRPAMCLAYVMDVHEGIFAAYAVPWNRSAENSGGAQVAPMVCVGSGQIRAPIAAKK